MNNKIIAFTLLSLAVAVLFYAYVQKNKVETKHNSFAPVVDIAPKQEIKIEQETKNESHDNIIKNKKEDLNIKNFEEDLNIDDLDADIDDLEL